MVIHSDSQLVVNQVNGTFAAKEPVMIRYLSKVKRLIQVIEDRGGKVELCQVPRDENIEADLLAKAAAEGAEAFYKIPLREELSSPSIDTERSSR